MTLLLTFYVGFFAFIIAIGVSANIGYFDDVTFVKRNCNSYCTLNVALQTCERSVNVCVTANGTQVCETQLSYAGCCSECPSADNLKYITAHSIMCFH